MEPLLPDYENGAPAVINSNNRTINSAPSSISSVTSSRILDRDGVNHQSRGRWRVEGRGTSTSVVTVGVDNESNARQYARACWDNWFHSLVYTPTLILLMFLMTYYMTVVIFFAWMYTIFSHHGKLCQVDMHNFLEAMFFSLSTMTTIGYGVKDYYFGDCWTFFLLVSFQVTNAILFDAVAIGLIFQRLSRGQKRGRSILFSDKAVLRKIRGSWYLFFRVGELRRKHFIIETRVRAHVIRHERSATETFYFVTRNTQVTLAAPNNNNNNNHHPNNQNDDPYLLMSLPQLLVHKLSPNSPLLPPSHWYDSNGQLHYFQTNHANTITTPTTTITQASNKKLVHDNDDTTTISDNNTEELLQMQQFWEDRQVELIVLIEGIDEVTGMTVQARHSYRYDDIVLNHRFVNCVFPAEEEEQQQQQQRRKRNKQNSSKKAIVVDWDLFHHVVPAPYDCQDCPYI